MIVFSAVSGMEFQISPGTLLGWKVLPGKGEDDGNLSAYITNQTSSDWSALYIQFSVHHAVSYLPNHYDRGEMHCQLVTVTTRKPIRCFILPITELGANKLNSFEKANLVRKELNDKFCQGRLDSSEPLLRSIGANFSAVLVLPDSSDDFECAAPHSMMTFDNFEFKTYAQFNRYPGSECYTQSVVFSSGDGEMVPLNLSKDERYDAGLLAARLDKEITNPRCTWVQPLINPSVSASEHTNSAKSSPRRLLSNIASMERVEAVLPLFNDILMAPVTVKPSNDSASDDSAIRRVTINQASQIAINNSMSVKTLPRRQNSSVSSDMPTNTFVASDGREYEVEPMCLPPPAEIAKFLRELKAKRDQGYFRMTPAKPPPPTPKARYPELPKDWMKISKLSAEDTDATPDKISSTKSVTIVTPIARKASSRILDDADVAGSPDSVNEDFNLPPIRNSSLYEIVMDDLFGFSDLNKDDGLTDDDADSLSKQNIENFIGVPPHLENLIWLGIAVCFESFLYAISTLHIRFIHAIYTLLWSKFNGANRTKNTRSHVFDLCRGGLVILGTLLLSMFNMSQVYHLIRTQTTIKLYAFTSMLEVFDRLLGSFGQDAMQYMHRACRNINDVSITEYVRNVSFSFLVASAYVAVHTSVYFIHVATLTVAVNTADKALMTVLIINNFAEIKSFAFKKFDKEALFVLSCSDITERFQILLFFVLISTLGLLHSDSLPWTDHVWNFGVLFAMMYGAEMLADWIKHAFVAKFNKIGPGIYRKYARILRSDVIFYNTDKVMLDHTHSISRRVGLAQVRLTLFVD